MLSSSYLEHLQKEEPPIVRNRNVEIGTNWLGITFDSVNSFKESGFVGFKEKEVPRLKRIDMKNIKIGCPYIFDIHEEIAIRNDMMGICYCRETNSPFYFYSAVWEPGYRGKGQLLGSGVPNQKHLKARILIKPLTKPTEAYKGSYQGEKLKEKSFLEKSSGIKGCVLCKDDIEKIIKEGVVTNILDSSTQLQPCGLDLTINKIFNHNGKEIELQEGKRTLLKRGVYTFWTNEKYNDSPYFVATAYSRSSLCRSGACITHVPLIEEDSLFGNNIKNALIVYNPHGLEIEKNSRVGQLVFEKYLTPKK